MNRITKVTKKNSLSTSISALCAIGLLATSCGASTDNATTDSSPAATSAPTNVEPPTTVATVDRSARATAQSERLRRLPSPTTTTPTTTTATTTTATTTTPTTTTPVTTTPATTDGNTAADSTGDEPLLINLTIHAEGWIAAVDQLFAHERHLEALLEVAETATEYGALLSTDVDTHLVQAMTAHGTEQLLFDLQDLGHEISVHADFGGKGNPTLEVFTSELVRQRDELAALGVETTNISGACSRGPWIEAVIAAGFDTVTGMVGFCMTSLDPANVPADARAYVAGCTSPAACHEAVQIPVEQRAVPWVANDSGDWLEPDTALSAADGVTLIVSESASGIHCPDGVCTIGGSEDASTITDWIDQYLDVQETIGEQAVLGFTWSIGSIPTDGFADELFTAISSYVDAGTVQWANNATIGALA